MDREALTQQMHRFLEEHQRREESYQANLEQRVAQFRHEVTEAMTEHAMTFVRIRQ